MYQLIVLLDYTNIINYFE